MMKMPPPPTLPGLAAANSTVTDRHCSCYQQRGSASLLHFWIVATALAILVSGRQWKAVFVLLTAVLLAGVQICSTIIAMNTTNFIRTHRRM